MIGSLRGTVLERTDDATALVEVGGVGYLVSVTPRTLAELEPVAHLGAARNLVSALLGREAPEHAVELLAAELQLPLDRWGGNDKERYNWRVATKNSGRATSRTTNSP